VKVVDANVLLYAVSERSAQHEAAKRWLTTALSKTEAVALPWLSLLAFMRVATNPQIFPRPLTVDEATATVEAWLGAPCAIALEPYPRHLPVLSGLLARAGIAGNLTNDAHLSALALEHGAEVVTFDRDLARFDVRVVVPGTDQS
jgi:toxin-antitoxin system PIN domain toxin